MKSIARGRAPDISLRGEAREVACLGSLSVGRRPLPLDRFPSMFGGPHLGLTLYHGWSAILLATCASIQKLLLDRPMTFHWVELQEDDGVVKCLYSLGGIHRYAVEVEGKSRRVLVLATQEDAGALAREIDAIVKEAERLSSFACLVCGAHAASCRYFGRQLPLCVRHQPELLNEHCEEGLQGVWRCAIEWQEMGSLIR